jgi:hypothetical protein
MIDTARPAGSTGMTEAILALRFDPTQASLSAADVHLGSLTASGWQLTMLVNAQTGEVAIDLVGDDPIQTTAGGSLVAISLHTHGNPAAGSTLLSLQAQVDPTGQHSYQTSVADAQGAFILHTASTTVQWQASPIDAGPASAGPAEATQAWVQAPQAVRADPMTSALAQVFADLGQVIERQAVVTTGQPNWLLTPATKDDVSGAGEEEAWLAGIEQPAASTQDALFEQGSGTVAGPARRVLRTTVADPFSNSLSDLDSLEEVISAAETV